MVSGASDPRDPHGAIPSQGHEFASGFGRPCPRELDVVSVVAQKQPNGSINPLPAPSHIRFEESDDPIIVPAAVLDSAK